MGLERIAAIMQHGGTNYEGMHALISLRQKLSGKSVATQLMRLAPAAVLQTTLDAVTFMIGDGILPGTTG